MSVAREQRFTRDHPCPICSGHEQAARGRGVRCFGFVSGDGKVAHCTREDYAGGLAATEGSGTYAHCLTGTCACGKRHAPSRGSPRASRCRDPRIVASYPYRDETGTLLFEVVRFKPKGFAQRRRDANGGFIYNLNGVRRVLYRSSELLAAEPGATVYIVEGEKDADVLAALGLIATTNPGGAGKWRSEYAEALRGRHVVVLPDNDDVGRKHAEQVARGLRRVAASVKLVPLPGLPENGDVSDWLAAGCTRKELEWLVAEVSECSAAGAVDGSEDGGGHDDREHPRDAEADASCFFDLNQFIPSRLGERLLDEAAIRLGHDRRLWRYVRGVYRPDGDDWTRQRVRELLGERFRRRHLDEVSTWLRAQLPSLGHEPPTQFINCRNGLLDWRSGKLRPHSRDVLSTNQIPVDWQSGATCPTIDRFFAQTIPWDAFDLVEELLGYALYPGNPFRKAVLMLGPGANGKTTKLNLLRALLGADNVAAVPLQALGEDRFAAADLFGKLANICGDLDARAIHRTDLFKQVTGGDGIRAEFKFRDAFSFVSYALPLFSANEAPRSADQTNAWFDRWIIIPMEHRFEGEADDPNLGAKLATELEGLLVRAVDGLRRLMARARFALPASVEKARARYRRTLDTVQAFVVEECHFDKEAWIDRADLYRRYRDWCRDGGRLSLANTTFNAHLLQAYGGKVVLRKRQGRPGWLGLAIGPAADAGEGDEGDDFPTLSNRARAHAHMRTGVSGNGVPFVPSVPESPLTPSSIDDSEEEFEL